MNCYLINARKTPHNHHYRFKWATTFFRYSFSSLIHSLSRKCAYTLFSLFPKSLFFSRFRLFVFFLFLFFISRWNPTKEHRYVKRSSTLFGALFRRRFSNRLCPVLLLTPVVSISILLLHPFPTLSHSLSLLLLTISSNPVSSKLCRILVRR